MGKERDTRGETGVMSKEVNWELQRPTGAQPEEAILNVILFSLETKFWKCLTGSSKLIIRTAAFIYECVTCARALKLSYDSGCPFQTLLCLMMGIWPRRISAACHQTDGNEDKQGRDHIRERNMFTEASVPSWDTKAAVCIDLKLISQWWKGCNF